MEENQKNIPKGWELDNLGKVVSFSTGKKDVNQGNPEGEYPFFTCSKTFTFSDEYSFDEEALMIAGNGDVGTVHYYKGKFEAYQRTYVLRDFKLDVQYLFQLLKSELIPHLLSGQSGTTIQFIKIGQLSNFQFLKPKSKNEQTQIATILSKVDEAITQTEQLIAKYTRIKTGLMQDLLTKGIDENGNIRSEETHEFKDSPLGRIPKEWECEILGNIFDLKTGITPLRSNSLFFAYEGYNWIKTLDLNESDLFTSEEKITEYALNKTAIKLRPINTILIAMYGGWQQIGRTSILKSEAATNQAITALINPKVKIYSEFLQLFLQQNRWRWKQYAVSTRKDPNITKNDIAKFYVLYPQDIKEQELVANKILRAKELANEYSMQLSKLQSLKTGLMQDLLSGKVRVNHLIKETANL